MSNSVAESDGSLRISDLESVAWVFSEVEQLLKQVQKILRLHLLENPDNQFHTGYSAEKNENTLALLDLQKQLKQGCSVLRMVNIEVGGLILSSLDKVISSFVNNRKLLNVAQIYIIDKACFALTEFLQVALKSKPVYPMGLFQPYLELNQIIDNYVQPADFWGYDWHWQDIEALPEFKSEQEEQEALQRLDRFMLSLLRGNISAAEDFKTIVLKLFERNDTPELKRFWALVAGFFDALCCGQASLNINTKRVASQVLNCYKSYQDEKTLAVDDYLGKTLLFFCVPLEGKRIEPAEISHPVLDTIRQAYHVKGITSVDYEQSLYGRIDPLLLKRVQKHIAETKAAWSALCSGEAIPPLSITKAFEEIRDSVVHLLPESKDFAGFLCKTASQVANKGQTPSAEIAMEIATAVLYVEAIFSENDINKIDLEKRFSRLTERIETVMKGNNPLPLDSWIRGLYHQVNERETISNVVDELRIKVNHVEESVDDFLRKSKKTQSLNKASIDLHQMHGVLNVLGMDDAAQAINAMQVQIAWLLRNQAKATPDIQTQSDDLKLSLIENLSSLGFFVDMLSYQPLVARKMFVFDQDSQKLQFLTGNAAIIHEIQKSEQRADVVDTVSQTVDGEHEPPMEFNDSTQSTLIMSSDSVLPEDESPKSVNLELMDADHKLTSDNLQASFQRVGQEELVVSQDGEQPKLETVQKFATNSENHNIIPLANEATPLQPGIDTNDDFAGDDLRSIFLEESLEVISNGRSELQKLYNDVDDYHALVAIRRCFHTLKGSSRMVGLMDFGSAAFSCEQCFNGWLSFKEKGSLPHKLLDFASWAFDQFEIWTQELLSSHEVTLAPEVFEKEALSVSIEQLAPVDDHDVASNQDDNVTKEQVPNKPEETDLNLHDFDSQTSVTPTVPEALSPSIELVDNPSEHWDPTLPVENEPIKEETAQKAYTKTKELLSNLSLSLDDSDFADDEIQNLSLNENISPQELNTDLSEDIANLNQTDSTTVEVDELEEAMLCLDEIQTSLDRWQEVGDLEALEKAKEQAKILISLTGKAESVGLISFIQNFENVIGEYYQKVISSGIPSNRSSTAVLKEVCLELGRVLDQFSKGVVDIPRMDLLIGLYQFSQQKIEIGTDVAAPDISSFVDEGWEEQVTDSFITNQLNVDVNINDLEQQNSPEVEDGQSSSLEIGYDEPLEISYNEDGVNSQEDIITSSSANGQAEKMLDLPLVSDEQAVVLDDDIAHQSIEGLGASLCEGVQAYQQLHPGDKEAVTSDIFEIFSEEARDLLPALSLSLREWSTNTSASEKLQNVLRILHTFKGSARMCNALHLGDLAHSLETLLKEIEEQKDTSQADITEVLERLDEIETEFENIRLAYNAYAAGVLDDVLMQVADESQHNVVDASVSRGGHSDQPAFDQSLHLSGAYSSKVEAQPVRSSEPDQDDIKAIKSDLFVVFKEETVELLKVIEQGINNWAHSENLTAYLLTDAMRALHTLKGNTRLVGANGLEQSVIRLESMLRTPDAKSLLGIQQLFSQIQAAFKSLCLARDAAVQNKAGLPQTLLPEQSSSVLSSVVSSPQEDSKPFTHFIEIAHQSVAAIAELLSQWCEGFGDHLNIDRLNEIIDDLKECIDHFNSPQIGSLLEDFVKILMEENGIFKPEIFESLVNAFKEVEVALQRFASQYSPSSRNTTLHSDELMRQLLAREFADSFIAQPIDIADGEVDLSVDLKDDEITVKEETESEKTVLVQSVGEGETLLPPVKDVQQVGSAPSAGHAIRKDIKPRLIKPTAARTTAFAGIGQMLRVRASLLDELVNRSGELNLQRGQVAGEVKLAKDSLLPELTSNLTRLRSQLRDIEIQAETQLASRMDAARMEGHGFDPLEFDRYTRIQELTRIMAESVNDIATVQKSLAQTASNIEDGLIAQARNSRELQHALLRARMVEFSSISERFYRTVRMAARECDKQVQLNIEGGEIEVDRAVLERIAPAFEHILRNCVVHGIELSEDRQVLGKPAAGKILIKLQQEGNDVSISISDDGSGLDLEKIKEKAIELKLIKPDSDISDHDLSQLIYKSGLSTTQQVTELAGRGVGLDMAHAEIVGLGGRIEVFSKRGQGTEFIMMLPLTTAVTQVLLISVEGKTFGIPVNLVESIQRFTVEQIKDAIERGKVDYLNEEIPAYAMSGLLGLNTTKRLLGEQRLQWLILHSGDQKLALAIDYVIGSQEVVIRNVGPQFAHLSGFAGLTVLSAGRIVLIYNPVVLGRVFAAQGRLSEVIEVSQEHESLHESAAGIESLSDDFSQSSQSTPRSNKIMVVDDSLTVRRVTQRLLEKAGFDVVLAKDGQDALDQIHEEIPALILSDIEMPRMDGFELVRQLRSKPDTQLVPIIMITSRIAQKHHDYANELGVNRYLGKPYVEDELLELVRHYAKA